MRIIEQQTEGGERQKVKKQPGSAWSAGRIEGRSHAACEGVMRASSVRYEKIRLRRRELPRSHVRPSESHAPQIFQWSVARRRHQDQPGGRSVSASHRAKYRTSGTYSEAVLTRVSRRIETSSKWSSGSKLCVPDRIRKLRPSRNFVDHSTYTRLLRLDSGYKLCWPARVRPDRLRGARSTPGRAVRLRRLQFLTTGSCRR